jgi:chromate transport protein ChrA
MKFERAILIVFLGNYLINTVAASLVSLIPATPGGGFFTPQYITFIILAVVIAGLLTWWYMRAASAGLVNGIIFGVIGVVMALLVAFVTGICGVLAQTGSFSSVVSVLPNFGPFIWNMTTLYLIGYWIIPAALVGWFMMPKVMAMGSSSMPPSRPTGTI